MRVTPVSVHCEYAAAVKFEDVLDIDVSVARLGEKSVTYAFAVSHAGRPVARMQLTAVCCRISADAPPTGIRVPDDFAQRLAPYRHDVSPS